MDPPAEGEGRDALVANLPASAQQFDRQALALEKRAREEAGAKLKIALAVAARELAAAYQRNIGSLRAPVPPQTALALHPIVRRIVFALATGMLSELPTLLKIVEKVGHDAHKLGLSLPKQGPIPAVAAGSTQIEQALRDDLKELQAYAERPLRHYRDALALVGKANQVITHAQDGAAHVVNQAANDAVAKAADKEGVSRLWIAERNACLTCLAYAGHLAEPGEPFPAGLTFGDRSTVGSPLYAPPAHPNCRCRLQKWYGQDAEFGISLPLALRREAQRSVMRGDSEYASRPAKMRAADRLLKAGLSGLPESVKLSAQRKVQAGVTAWKPAKR